MSPYNGGLGNREDETGGEFPMGANGEQDTIEEIEDNLFWLGGEDSVTPTEVVAETIAKLPADVRQWAPNALHWFCPPSCNGQALTMLLNKVTINQVVEERDGEPYWVFRIIYIAPDVFEQPRAEQQRVIAHEIAHHWLRHEGAAIAGGEFEKREDDAEKLVREWGFS